MERSIEIRTPESVAFSYDLAGLGSRFLALVFDMLLQGGAIVAFFVALGILASRLPQGASSLNPRETQLGTSIGVALVVIVFFLLFYGYFILFEALWDGRTPGKKLLGIRVVRDGGYPVDFASVLVRNITRIGEQLIGFYVISAVSAVLSPENKRIGDYAAGTIVVRENRANYRPSW